MDNLEVASNCSYNSDSLQSTVSSLSSLSLYQHEFAELRHLVNPSKYPQPVVEKASTPTPGQESEGDINKVLQNQLQQSLELNEHYKVDIGNVERTVGLRYCERIKELLRSNRRLEAELSCANTHISRLIEGRGSYNEKLQVEKEIKEIREQNFQLQEFSAKLQRLKNEVDLENKNLKLSLSQVTTERHIKESLIENLKEKVSQQYVELQESLRECSSLRLLTNDLSTKLSEADKLKLWYKEQLSQCQNDKTVLSHDFASCQSQLGVLKETNLKLNLELTEYKCEVDKIRLQALKEKTDLLEKLENINLEETPIKTLTTIEFKPCQDCHQDNQESNEEVGKLKTVILSKDKEIEKLRQENSNTLSKCIILQKTLQQKESDIEALESRQKELTSRLEHLRESETEKVNQVTQLQNTVAELKVELSCGKVDKRNVEQQIEMLRGQFMQFKENYNQMKNELNQRNKDVLKLEREKQELFMSNSWNVCELSKLKNKDELIDRLKKDGARLEADLQVSVQKMRKLEFENLKLQEAVKANELICSEKNTLTEEKNAALNNYHNAVKSLEEAEARANTLSKELDMTKADVSSKDLALSIAVNTIEQLQADHKRQLQSMSLTSQALQQNLKSSDATISELTMKLKSFESDLKRATDDQKVELRQAGENHTKAVLKNVERYVVTFFDSLNTEEFASQADIRLKYLDERLRALKGKSEQLEEKLRNNVQLERIRELEVLLQVRDRDMKEKQLKMDRNNRTLLRKVKEHMKGRNYAEKQLENLQELYNSLAEERNTLELSLASKHHELVNLEKFCETLKVEMDKLRLRVGTLEEQLIAKTHSCVEAETSKERLSYFRSLCGELEQKLETQELVLKQRAKKIDQMEVELSNKNQLITRLNLESESFRASLGNVEDFKLKCNLQLELIENLGNQLVEKELLNEELEKKVETLKHELAGARDQAEYLIKEVKLNSSNLQQTVEHLQESKQTIADLELRMCSDREQYENTLSEYRSRVSTLENDKYFFQRLSKDLKVALTSYMDSNKKLQNQLSWLVLKESESALNNNNNSIIGKYDEECIRQLLAENKACSKNKVLASAEIQDCLNKLRDEICNLQLQITKKNGHSL